ncbi:MAG: bifunctional glycosyltransferase family 2/GtrA family protein [Clostridia bacterium]|nr:bifunctional glycosyltransferase family 2/GtrA family protein [Clostridia bacterium]
MILIPAYQPDEKLNKLIADLNEATDAKIVVVDDGSDADRAEIFCEAERNGCTVLHHEKNRGKGAAIKTGIAFVRDKMPDCGGIVTVDADGQHRTEDVLKVAELVAPGKLVLGTRDLRGRGVPARSKFGNFLTSAFFRLLTGRGCSDTQTGLRGIPADLFEAALLSEGDRYEYEMNFLTDLADKKIPFECVRIGTVYDKGNTTSHFRPVRDSLRIYKKPLRFAASSMICSVADLGLFTLIDSLLGAYPHRIVAATVCARLVSGVMNFTLNKKWSFNKKGDTKKQLFKYALLFVAQMFTSAFLVSLLSLLPLHDTVWKILVDVTLFFVSFAIQRRWVYTED